MHRDISTQILSHIFLAFNYLNFWVREGFNTQSLCIYITGNSLLKKRVQEFKMIVIIIIVAKNQDIFIHAVTIKETCYLLLGIQTYCFTITYTIADRIPLTKALVI